MLRCSLKFNPQSVIRCQQFALWVKMSNSPYKRAVCLRWNSLCLYLVRHDFVTFLEDLGDLVHFSLYKGWNFPFLLGDILKIP